MKKAFAYIRVSGKSQLHGDGFPRQEAAIRSYAKAHQIKIVAVYKELGVSGTKNIIERPAFIAMIEALLTDGVKLVIVESLSRLARDLMVQESIIADLNRRGFELASATEPELCGDEPGRKLIRQFMGAMFEFERKMTVLKLRGARQRVKAKRGRCEGRKRFGFSAAEREILDRMIALDAASMTATEIAKTLNKEGLKTRSGREWLQPTVSKILNRAKAEAKKKTRRLDDRRDEQSATCHLRNWTSLHQRPIYLRQSNYSRRSRSKTVAARCPV
ncbi:MAG: recombinase family protein [Bryobacteraceae bacterium]